MSAGKPVAPSRGRLRPLDLGEVEITGGFWAPRQAVNSSATLAHCHGWMERLGWVDNFRRAADGTIAGHHEGMVFADSDVYKLMEAMAWEVGRSGSADADQRFRELTAVIAPAQESDGYLNTVFGRPGQPPRYSDLEWGHELYNDGHLLQAAVARRRTTGDDEFVAIAMRVADHVCETFADGGIERVGGHPEIELGLVELARETGSERYLDQAATVRRAPGTRDARRDPVRAGVLPGRRADPRGDGVPRPRRAGDVPGGRRRRRRRRDRRRRAARRRGRGSGRRRSPGAPT